MKNKSITYLLLGGVLLIWGLVFYKIFMGIDSTKDDVFLPTARKTNPLKVEEQKEALVLLANYRDPFLGNIQKNNATIFDGNSARIKPKVIKAKKEEILIDWSFIDYIGIVYNKETKKNVGLLSISGKEYMVNDLDVINEVIIQKKTRDSIWVEYKGSKKWIKR